MVEATIEDPTQPTQPSRVVLRGNPTQSDGEYEPFDIKEIRELHKTVEIVPSNLKILIRSEVNS